LGGRLLDWAMMIAAMEEARSRVAVEARVTHPISRTVCRVLANVPVPSVIMDVRGAGCLRELLLRSVDRDYVLRVYVDGSVLFDAAFSWFMDVSQIVEGVSAFQGEGGDFILHLTGICWADSFKVEVDHAFPVLSASKRLTLKQVIYKFDMYVMSGVEG